MISLTFAFKATISAIFMKGAAKNGKFLDRKEKEGRQEERKKGIKRKEGNKERREGRNVNVFSMLKLQFVVYPPPNYKKNWCNYVFYAKMTKKM